VGQVGGSKRSRSQVVWGVSELCPHGKQPINCWCGLGAVWVCSSCRVCKAYGVVKGGLCVPCYNKQDEESTQHRRMTCPG
jgi:hypothetical protein